MDFISNQYGSKLTLLLLLIAIYYSGGMTVLLTEVPQWAPLIQEGTAIFLSIIVEALPLILVGIFISAFLHTFVSDTLIRKLLPRNPLLGIAVSCMLGIIFPLCECGIVPIVRRLIQKGVPAYMAVAFMLSAPVINPLVAYSTFLAFNTYPTMVVYRLLGTLLVAGAVAGAMSLGKHISPLSSQHSHNDHCCNHHHHPSPNLLVRLKDMVYHATDEFFDMGRFLLIGSFLATVIQIAVPRTELLAFGQQPLLSVIGMMVFAFVISVCSQADAFIAAPFLSSFSTGAIAAFLIFGPMLDVKNLLMLCSTFKLTYVVKLVFLITCASFGLALTLNYLPHIWGVIVGG